MRPSTRLVAALLFGSGLTSLIYQTAWQRMFRLVFGASTAASAAVLGIFLGGLGLGALLFGKRAERSERPLAFYGNLELGVALFAAVTPLLVELCSSAYFALGGSGRLGTGGATLVRLVIAALVMGPSVVLMGGTLPAAARAVESDGDAARARLALLYATNTLGAVFGALLATFLLFELFGTQLSLWSAVLVNLLVALVARSIGRDSERIPLTIDAPAPAPALVTDETVGGTSAAPQTAGAEPPVSPVFVYVSAGIVGFVFLCSELVWYRMLAPILGGSSFTFGLILAVALLGIGSGGYLYSRRRREHVATLNLFVLTIFLEALAIGIPFALGDGIALYAAYTRELGSSGFWPLVFSWFVVASVVILPAAVVSGYQFPVIFALLGRGRRHVARHVGLAYACNTLGAIAGALLGGFVLIPELGATGTWRFLVLVLVGLGLVAMALGLRALPMRRWTRSMPLVPLGLAACMCLVAEGPSALWRHGAIGAGRLRLGQGKKNELIASKAKLTRDLLWERDGLESAVGMTASDGLGFVINGKTDGSVFMDRGTQTMLGLAAAALHPEPKTVFVLGLGTGMTAGWVSTVPGVERVDVAELEPAVVEVARAAASVNQRVLERPNVHLFEGDGREFMLTASRGYDLILSEPSNPYRAGIASLFTRDFYAVVEQRLNPGGIFAQWLQGYEIDVETLRVVLRTLRSVFPVIEIWHTQSDDLMLIGSRQPLRYDIASIRRRLATEPFLSALPRMWLVEGAEGLFSHFLATDGVSRSLGDVFSSPINTDDSTVLEYAFARHVGTHSAGMSAQVVQLASRLGQERPDTVGELDWERVRELRGRAWNISRNQAPLLPGLSRAARDRAEGVELGCSQRFSEVLLKWGLQPARPAPQPMPAESPPLDPLLPNLQSERPAALNAGAAKPASPPVLPRDIVEVFVIANGYAHHADERAVPLAVTLASRGFLAEAALVRARFHVAREQPEKAVAELVPAIAQLRHGSISLCDTSDEVLRMLPPLVRGKPELARQTLAVLMAGPLSAYLSEQSRTQTAQAIAFDLKDPESCLAALGDDLHQPRWDARLLRARRECLALANHSMLAQAELDLSLFYANTPGQVADGIVLPDEPPVAQTVTVER